MDTFDYVALSLAAIPIATGLVTGYKYARPAASSLSIWLMAMLMGCISSFLLVAVKGVLNTWASFTLQMFAFIVLAGILAGLAASGLRASDKSADEQRTP